jgi:osmotically-inducible protein OsmY
MRFPQTLAALALACALPAVAQTSSTTTTTTTTGGTSVANVATTNGTSTSITGGTGQGTVSATGAVVNPAQDQVLVSQIVAELANDPAMAGAQIDVQVVGGRVTLNGIAVGVAQAEAARSTAQAIAGSANVSSNLSTSRQ